MLYGKHEQQDIPLDNLIQSNLADPSQCMEASDRIQNIQTKQGSFTKTIGTC